MCRNGLMRMELLGFVSEPRVPSVKNSDTLWRRGWRSSGRSPRPASARRLSSSKRALRACAPVAAARCLGGQRLPSTERHPRQDVPMRSIFRAVGARERPCSRGFALPRRARVGSLPVPRDVPSGASKPPGRNEGAGERASGAIIPGEVGDQAVEISAGGDNAGRSCGRAFVRGPILVAACYRGASACVNSVHWCSVVPGIRQAHRRKGSGAELLFPASVL